ncbi:alpha/beta hydrolase family protein [Myceligenerans pegani]|uniref:Alpha/beta hydrolase n=1 Tax=Myceligenerans pegani TaxID=2776917 RepID=A0ABR9N2B6_9MICO|nr:alpha/beta hydrolase [Myceligenerans sp. TRM 65318]MBE1877790.1 alpha/beta hydrolase [Myceligenerans sp. TRM 65318]MBE3020061.1 alpha/beta hydrolase [Myceligenerans sp. TRM 65318]
MLFRTAVTSAAILLGLAAAGALAGPGWNPDPVTDHIRPAAEDTAIGGDDGGIRGLPGPGRFEVRETAVTIELDDGASVDGLLREPVVEDPGTGAASESGTDAPPSDGPGTTAGAPGVVFVHGAGTGKASDAFTEAATALASAGIVTLVPDKYLAHYSTRHRDYVEMAGDYQHSVEFLRGVPGVDPERVGIYAESEGGWVAPVMTAEDPALAFQVWVSAPVVPPRQQAAFAMDNYLRNTGVPQGVFRAIPRAVGMRLPGGGFEYADFDVQPWLDRQTVPILMAYGATDPSMPMEQAVRQVLAETAAGAGDAPVTVRFYAGANHGINVSDEPLGDDIVPHGDDLHLHPGFARDVAAWVHGLPASATAKPRIAGAQPRQLYLAAPVPQPHWYADGDVVLGIAIGSAALLVGGGATLLTTRLRRTRVARRLVAGLPRGRAGDLPTTRQPPDQQAPRLAAGMAAPLAVMAGVAVATAAGLVAYLLAVARLALDYEQNALVVQGGWVGVRALGIVAVVAAAVLLLRCRAVRWRVVSDDGGRAGTRIVTAAFWAVAAGSVALGLLLAHWGVYQLGI